jgi:hypothetical protein
MAGVVMSRSVSFGSRQAKLEGRRRWSSHGWVIATGGAAAVASSPPAIANAAILLSRRKNIAIPICRKQNLFYYC